MADSSNANTSSSIAADPAIQDRGVLPSTSSKIFSLQGKGLKINTRAEFEPYISTLRDIKDTVEEIHLGGNTFGVEACNALAEVLKELKVLKVADFADIFTGRLISEIPSALAALCDALKDSKTLVELDLSDNAFGGRSAEPMVPFLTNNRTFQILKLNNNGLGISGGTTVASALLESASLSRAEGKKSQLRTVICGRNRLENGSAAAWAQAFKAHGGLVEVRLPQNGIRMEGIENLAAGLSACPNLQHLDFQDNTCTERGSRAIARALPSWPDLRTLNLSDCLLGRKGGNALFSALNTNSNPKLETLKLQYGELDKAAMELLARAIADYLSCLVSLELNGNRVDPEDDVIVDIRSALESHGHGDALDELDDMEEIDEDEAAGSGEDQSDNEEPAEDEGEIPLKPTATPSKVSDTDELADLMGKISLGP